VSDKQKLNKTRIKKSTKLLSQGKQIVQDFTLTGAEVEDIFDLIAEEYPEL